MTGFDHRAADDTDNFVPTAEPSHVHIPRPSRERSAFASPHGPLTAEPASCCREALEER